MPQADKLIFTHLPAYALFIRDNHLVPYIQEQLKISREVNLPMLRFFEGIADDELISMSISSHREFLTSAGDNHMRQQLEKALTLWVADQLGTIKREEVTAEDITLASYMRKKALIKFLSYYTSDVNDAIAIINEIDIYTVESDTAATNIYLKLLKQRVNEQVFFTEVISNTTPGLNYVLNIENRQINYANKNATQFFGIDQKELHDMGSTFLEERVHPDDLADTVMGLASCTEASDGAVLSWEMRLKNVAGAYVWMRNYASVFKRNTDGVPVEIVGIILDIDREKETAAQLMLREAELMKSEDLYKQAQARTHIGNWTWDIKADKVSWSDEMYRIYGLEPQSVTVNYEMYMGRIHTEDRADREHQLQAVMETGMPEDHHYRIVMDDNSVRILHTKSELYYDVDGKPGQMTGTCQDVTDKQLLIQRLQESERLNKHAQAISHMGNWTLDMSTKKLEWSDEVYRIYNLEPQSLATSHTLDKYNHPDDKEMVRLKIAEALETQQAFDFSYRIVLDKGIIKTLHAKGEVERAATGNPQKIYGTVQDITEQKAVEKRLKDYQEFIGKITDVTPSIIATYNIHTGKYSFINEAVEKLLGYPAAKIMQEGVAFLSTLVHPDDVQTMMEKNGKALEDANKLGHNGDEPIVEFKYRVRNSDGMYRWMHTYGTIFERNEEGLVESVLNISVDITEQEVAEQELYQKNLQLQQSNTSLEEYAYITSHDLKEPLRKIATFSDRILMTQKDVLHEEGKQYLTKIIESSRRMQKMINDLLSVSTILGNKSYETVSLNTLVDEALQSLDHKIEEQGAIVDTEPLPTVSVVPSQFRQLFQNLVNNSLKFAREGVPSHITIGYKFLTSKAVAHLDLKRTNKYLQIELQDNGIGFDNQYADKIFAIFQRLHGVADYEGTGIGLAVCKKIVENHEGIIYAQGIQNQGATFTIIIPL